MDHNDTRQLILIGDPRPKPIQINCVVKNAASKRWNEIQMRTIGGYSAPTQGRAGSVEPYVAYNRSLLPYQSIVYSTYGVYGFHGGRKTRRVNCGSIQGNCAPEATLYK